MACIIWQMPDGTEFLIEEGVSHFPPPGSWNTGRVDWNCGKIENSQINYKFRKCSKCKQEGVYEKH